MNAASVTICVCTYRRPDGLRALLEGVRRQVFEQVRPPQFDVVIADNESSIVARQICRDFQDLSGIPVTYVNEPRRGISYARNACLSHVSPTCDYFAMIDDDEIPEPDWLEQLLLAQAATNADVVQGRVIPTFSEGVPNWIAAGGFFGWPRNTLHGLPVRWMDGQTLDSAATNNVLVRWSPVHHLGLRFDPRLALSGGEDAVFFRRLRKAGSTIAYAAKAKVLETVPRNRACLAYLVREQYKRGALKLRKKMLVCPGRPSKSTVLWMSVKIGLRGCATIASGLGSVLVLRLTSKEQRGQMAVGLLRAANGLGMLASAVGIRYQHYADGADSFTSAQS